MPRPRSDPPDLGLGAVLRGQHETEQGTQLGGVELLGGTLGNRVVALPVSLTG